MRQSHDQVSLRDPLDTIETRNVNDLDDEIAISTAEFRGDQPAEFFKQMEADQNTNRNSLRVRPPKSNHPQDKERDISFQIAFDTAAQI